MAFLITLAIAIGAFVAYRTSKGSPDRRPVSSVALLISAGFALLALGQCFTVIPAGNIGVVDFFGTVSENTLKAGINPVNPLARVVKMTVQTQEMKEVMDVPSKEGLTV
jgi:regulator of protease activity HflC (stomatin/prohibitin superfamily)